LVTQMVADETLQSLSLEELLHIEFETLQN
jgi:hypothetical protein